MKAIGLKRLTVKLLPHDKKWEIFFEKEVKKLRKLFENIEHVGSTSIKQIKAKPIIDMIVGVSSMTKASSFIAPLKKLGYEYRPQASRKNQLFFAKGKENNRTHYLHLIKHNGIVWQDYIFFRDHLNSSIKAAKAYEKLKMELAEKFSGDRPKYTKAKQRFIKNILKRRRK